MFAGVEPLSRGAVLGVWLLLLIGFAGAVAVFLLWTRRSLAGECRSVTDQLDVAEQSRENLSNDINCLRGENTALEADFETKKKELEQSKAEIRKIIKAFEDSYECTMDNRSGLAGKIKDLIKYIWIYGETHRVDMKHMEESEGTLRAAVEARAENFSEEIMKSHPGILHHTKLLKSILENYISAAERRVQSYKKNNTAKRSDEHYNRFMTELIQSAKSFSEAVEKMSGSEYEDLLSHSMVSEEEKRINQYDAIIQLYNSKIAKIRTQDMDEEDRDDAIAHWKRLRDTEIEELTRASDV